jgi:UDP-glucuronate decarboxylase
MFKQNILVTGGAGFIGSHLCEKLLKKYNVICLDDFSTGSEQNINHLVQFPNFELVRQDISEPFSLERMPELAKFQLNILGIYAVFNLACPTSAKSFDKYKIASLDANALGMKNIMEVVVKNKAKFVHLSSSVVYGGRDRQKGKVKENDLGLVNHLSPRGCYDEGKRFAETVVATYAQYYNTDYKIARVFRTYGPRQRLFDGEMIVDFIVDAEQGKDLVVYGDEKFSTALIYISDVVDGLIRLLDAKRDIGPVNIGSDVDLQLSYVAQKIIDTLESKSKIKFAEPLPFITELSLPDISKARDELSWMPLVRLEDGLRATIEYTLAHKELLGI